jgi:hypothetical protein
MTAALPEQAAAEAAAPAEKPLVLRSSEFRKGREASWRELEGLIARAERRSLAVLSVEEAQRLPTLYRSALSSLSVARSIALDRNLLLFWRAFAFGPS